MLTWCSGLSLRLRRLSRDQAASVSLELALVLPLLCALFLSGTEYVRFAILNQKLERATAMVADMIAQSPALTLAEINSLFAVVDDTLQPFALNDDGRVIVSSVTGTATTPVVNWQEDFGHGSDESKVGAVGATATLPNGLTLADGENVIVSEVYYEYQPILLDDVFNDTILYRVSANRPRFGSLAEPPS
ncbi:MAG: TadE/TadG family type IV pilus assembly protein [Defluviicoccus sp.]|nr:TadE/TadG family type IV pilus assembly protein [Defluviicoccus sp.]MDG4609777.1 TadE/TadG family type IV pilus assembly protein [Defluviicoccus sp.]